MVSAFASLSTHSSRSGGHSSGFVRASCCSATTAGAFALSLSIGSVQAKSAGPRRCCRRGRRKRERHHISQGRHDDQKCRRQWQQQQRQQQQRQQQQQWRCVTRPGDALFVPSGVWHAVESLPSHYTQSHGGGGGGGGDDGRDDAAGLEDSVLARSSAGNQLALGINWWWKPLWSRPFDRPNDPHTRNPVYPAVGGAAALFSRGRGGVA